MLGIRVVEIIQHQAQIPGFQDGGIGPPGQRRKDAENSLHPRYGVLKHWPRSIRRVTIS